MFFWHVFLFCSLLFFSHCGRKKNDFLSFPPLSEQKKINKLMFPSVRGITIKNTPQGTFVQWHALSYEQENIILKGYNIYVFHHNSVIPKKPRNAKPLQTTMFLLQQKPDDSCFLIRGVFETQGKTIEGPASQIICNNN